MASIFSIHPFETILHTFKINSSDILFHSSSIAVVSEPIFEGEVAFLLVCETPHSAYSRGLKSGLHGGHKETPVISEIF